MRKRYFDDNGNIIKEEDYNPCNILEGSTTFEYDENGNIIKQVNYDSLGNSNFELYTDYDSKGNIIKESRCGTFGRLACSYSFNSDGTIKDEYISDDSILKKWAKKIGFAIFLLIPLISILIDAYIFNDTPIIKMIIVVPLYYFLLLLITFCISIATHAVYYVFLEKEIKFFHEFDSRLNENFVRTLIIVTLILIYVSFNTGNIFSIF